MGRRREICGADRDDLVDPGLGLVEGEVRAADLRLVLGERPYRAHAGQLPVLADLQVCLHFLGRGDLELDELGVDLVAGGDVSEADPADQGERGRQVKHSADTD